MTAVVLFISFSWRRRRYFITDILTLLFFNAVVSSIIMKSVLIVLLLCGEFYRIVLENYNSELTVHVVKVLFLIFVIMYKYCASKIFFHNFIKSNLSLYFIYLNFITILIICINGWVCFVYHKKSLFSRFFIVGSHRDRNPFCFDVARYKSSGKF